MFFMSSSALKGQARAALKNHWLTALQIALIVNLPSLLVTGVASFTGRSQSALLNAAVEAATSQGVVNSQILLNGLSALVRRSDLWVLQGAWLVAWLLTPILALGMNVWTLNRLRGETGEVTTVFCRLRIAHKAVGLRLFMLLKVFLWMIPGVALSFLAMLPVINSTATVWEDLVPALNTTLRLTSLASLVMTVPAVIAYLRYSLADLVMAEKPETGVRASVAESKKLMAGKKGTLFCLLFSFILWYFAETLASGLVASLFGSVASLTVQLLASLALNIYVQMSVCAFYKEALRLHSSAGAEEPENGAGPEENNDLN